MKDEKEKELEAKAANTVHLSLSYEIKWEIFLRNFWFMGKSRENL